MVNTECQYWFTYIVISYISIKIQYKIPISRFLSLNPCSWQWFTWCGISRWNTRIIDLTAPTFLLFITRDCQDCQVWLNILWTELDSDSESVSFIVIIRYNRYTDLADKKELLNSKLKEKVDGAIQAKNTMYNSCFWAWALPKLVIICIYVCCVTMLHSYNVTMLQCCWSVGVLEC